MNKRTLLLSLLGLILCISTEAEAQPTESLQARYIGCGTAQPTTGWGLISKENIRLEDQNTIGIDFYASTTNSSGGIKKVATIEFDDPNGGNAFTNDDLQISNISSTTGDIEFFTLRDAINVNSMKFEGGNNGNGTAFQILHSNNVSLTLQGDGDMTIGGSLTENSDRRLKTNISRLGPVLNSLASISAYRYKWKSESRGQETQLGLIAQEVQAEFPELVSADDEGTLSVSYTKMVPVLLEAIKEQQQMIEKLTGLVEAQSVQVAELSKSNTASKSKEFGQ